MVGSLFSGVCILIACWFFAKLMLVLNPPKESVKKMKLKKILPFAMIVGFCYFYTGSAYMSQFYRLMDYFDDQTVDLITSCYFYLLQAAGVGAFSFLLWKKPGLFE